MPKKRRRNRGNNRKGIICISAVVLILLVSLFVQSSTIKQKNADYAQKEASIKAQIEEEKKRTKEIDQLKEHMKTKEYVEEIARDKLGLVYEDEIVFKEDNK